MAVRYQVTKYSFRQPNLITESKYNELKYLFETNANFTLIDNEDTVEANFPNYYKMIKVVKISSILLPVFWLLSEKFESMLVIIPFAITMLLTVGGLIIILMSFTDITSYKRYIEQKKNYLENLEKYIKTTSDYELFLKFYKQ